MPIWTPAKEVQLKQWEIAYAKVEYPDGTTKAKGSGYCNTDGYWIWHNPQWSGLVYNEEKNFFILHEAKPSFDIHQMRDAYETGFCSGKHQLDPCAEDFETFMKEQYNITDI